MHMTVSLYDECTHQKCLLCAPLGLNITKTRHSSVLIVLIFCWLFTDSHDEMKTQWEHPKTGKKKRCAGGWYCIFMSLMAVNVF